MASRREGQDEYLDDAVDAGLQELVIGVLDICGASTQKSKYVHLLKLLSVNGLIEYEDDLFPVKRGYSETLNRIKDRVKNKNKKDWPKLKVVYVQPHSTSVIEFEKFARIIEDGEGEGIRGLFAKRLRTWAADKAGSRNPKDWDPS